MVACRPDREEPVAKNRTELARPSPELFPKERVW